MILIYSDKEIKGIGGTYIAPRFFDGNLESNVEMVYTNDAKIKEAYTAKGVEVKGFPRTSQQAESKTILDKVAEAVK